MSESTWIAMVGGGVSSLMLGLQLAQHGRLPGPVVISESRTALSRSQSFGFWLKDPHPLAHLISDRWNAWGFSLQSGQTVIQNGHEYQYVMVEGERFFQWAETELNAHPDIHLALNTRVTEMPKAKYVFDSRPPEPSDFIACQSFVGFEVEEQNDLSHDVLQNKNPSVAQLMSSMHVIDQSLVFLYELPLANGRTLIEWTAFGARPFKLEILTDLGRKRAGMRHIVRQEQGIIPMGLKPSAANWGIPIGARAGMTRAASGYGFLRMWDWADAAAHTLVTQDRLPASLLDFSGHPTLDPGWLRWMDRCLLRLIADAPEQLPDIFMQLGARLRADDFARFMMDPSGVSAYRMILAAPKKPFIFSAIGLSRWI